MILSYHTEEPTVDVKIELLLYVELLVCQDFYWSQLYSDRKIQFAFVIVSIRGQQTIFFFFAKNK